MRLRISITRDPAFDSTIPLPAYETAGAAGADLRANFPDGQGVILPPHSHALIPTGLRIALPVGYEIQLRPRSGLALKHGITLLNAPGTIDSDYRGLVGVILHNTSTTDFQVDHGSRIAQIVVAPVVQAEFSEVCELDTTSRGAGGFGSTGLE